MKHEGVRKLWSKYAYVAAAVLIGIVLLLWPSGNGNTEEVQETVQIRQLQTELEEILSAISGVGQVKVLLTGRDALQRVRPCRLRRHKGRCRLRRDRS